MNPKKIWFPILSILSGIVITVIALELIFRFLPVSDSLKVLPVNSKNPVMKFEENRNITWSKGWNFSIIVQKHINNYGFLNDQDYQPDDNTPLLAIIGDSYVEACQVKNRDSMHGILSKEISERGRVYSFGASGSPLATYLAYANYARTKFDAEAVVFIIVGNDFDESLTKYKTDPGFHYFSSLSKKLELIRIDFHPTLIKRLARQSALIRYIALNLKFNWQYIENIFNWNAAPAEKEYVGNTRSDTNEERVLDSKKAIDRFFEELPLQTGLGSDKILFVLDGIRPHLYNQTLLKRADNTYFYLMREYLKKAALKNKYELIDMQPIFIEMHQSEGIRFEFPSDGHWNAVAHRLVAAQIKKSDVYRSLFK